MKKDLFCLLVDDDPDDHDIFLMAIKKLPAPIEFDWATNGREAIEKLNSYGERLPDFIFLDLNMHIMNGIECLFEIKKIPRVSEIPVIIYSTTLNERIIYETLQLGAFDHIEKPKNLKLLEKYLFRIFQIEEMA